MGRPIPTLFSIDEAQRVIYLNTFSKTIAPSIRISYMILPPRLMEVYREKLGFYACTVSGFEQYTLAKFMAQGRYEQHLSRMKARYRQKRDAVIAMLRSSRWPDGWRSWSRTPVCTFWCGWIPVCRMRRCGAGRAEQGCVWRCCRTITASRRQRPSISWW